MMTTSRPDGWDEAIRLAEKNLPNKSPVEIIDLAIAQSRLKKRATRNLPNSRLTEEERSLAAKRAVEARWAKRKAQGEQFFR